MATIQELAEQVQAQMETRTRDNGDRFVCFKDGRPDWMQDLALTAHGDMGPDDWRYSFIEDAIDAIVDADDEDDARASATEPSVYTSDLTGWLHSRVDRYSYVDEAVQEYGGHGESLTDDLMMGQTYEKEEVFGLVWQFLADMAEEDDEE